MAEPFEEFEFKPLTEGLGFHKKADKIKADIKSSNFGQEVSMRSLTETPTRNSSMHFPIEATTPQPERTAPRSASQSISELMASLPPSLDFLDDKTDLTRSMTSSSSATTSERPQIFQPLAREEYKSFGGLNVATGPTVGSVLPTPGSKAAGSFATSSMTSSAAAIAAPTIGSMAGTLGGIAPTPYRDRMSEGFNRAFPQTEKASETSKQTSGALIKTAASFSAGIVDAMIVAGLSTILLVCILTITKINLVGMLSNAATDGSTQIHLGLLFLAVLQMYMLTSRAFFGATLGEWAFELQMGRDEDQRRAIYPVQVMLRSLLITATGLVLIPLLSFAFNRDIAKYFTGLQLYRRP